VRGEGRQSSSVRLEIDIFSAWGIGFAMVRNEVQVVVKCFQGAKEVYDEMKDVDSFIIMKQNFSDQCYGSTSSYFLDCLCLFL